MPMDETLGVAAIDLGGRPHAVVDTRAAGPTVGDLQSELIQDFFEGFAQGVRGNMHVKVLYGRSSHHQVEAIFKAFGRALRVACSKDNLGRTLPSTKGLLVIALIDYGAGNLTSVAQGAGRGRRAGCDAGAAPGASMRCPASSCRVSAISRRPRPWTPAWRRPSSPGSKPGTAAPRNLSRAAMAFRREHGGPGARGLGIRPCERP